MDSGVRVATNRPKASVEPEKLQIISATSIRFPPNCNALSRSLVLTGLAGTAVTSLCALDAPKRYELSEADAPSACRRILWEISVR